MKFVIRQMFFVILLISAIYNIYCEQEVKNIRLNHLPEILPTKITEDYRTSATNIDQDCVRNLFGLSQNEEMTLKESEATILANSALLKCWNEKKVFERYFDAIAHIYMKDYLDCMKWHLQQLEPDSVLLENFNMSQYEPGYCKNVFDFPYKQILQKHEKTYGPVKQFSCGAVTGMDDFVKFATKLVLIKYGEYSDEVKETEMKMLKFYFKDITFRTANCIIKRFESDFIGWFIKHSFFGF